MIHYAGRHLHRSSQTQHIEGRLPKLQQHENSIRPANTTYSGQLGSVPFSLFINIRLDRWVCLGPQKLYDASLAAHWGPFRHRDKLHIHFGDKWRRVFAWGLRLMCTSCTLKYIQAILKINGPNGL